FIVPVPNRGEASASSLGVHGRESPASRSFLSRGSGGGWQRQWCTWSVPGVPRELLCSFRDRSGRAKNRSGLPRTRGLTRRESIPLPKCRLIRHNSRRAAFCQAQLHPPTGAIRARGGNLFASVFRASVPASGNRSLACRGCHSAGATRVLRSRCGALVERIGPPFQSFRCAL